MRPATTASIIALTAASFVGLAACGTDVVVHPGSDGGSGAGTVTTTPPPTTTTTGGTTTPTATTTTWTTTPTGTGGSGAAIPELCANFCELAQACGEDPSCPNECVTAYSPDCTTVYAAFLNCLLATFDPATCALPAPCQSVMNQWAECEGEPPPPCGPQSCGVSSDGSCDCSMQCSEGTYEASCTPQAGGSTCRCSFAGESLGECTGTGPMPCDVQGGCCASYFFWDEA